MIGCSLSYCVQDICEGKVFYEDVEKIVAGIKAENWIEFKRICDDYCRMYWSENPVEARKIAFRLYFEEKIIMPRLETPEKSPYIGEMRTHWVNSEEEIIYDYL